MRENEIMEERSMNIPKAVLVLACALALPAAAARGEESVPLDACLADGGFDARAAKTFGADSNGMKRYVIALLNRGPNRPIEPVRARELQAAHLKNIQRLVEEGKLLVAGPFLGEGDLRGIYIFDVAPQAAAKPLTATDPALKAGSLVMEFQEWYGSAALVAVPALHRRVSPPPAEPAR
jgi:uncharacterized protein YciI